MAVWYPASAGLRCRRPPGLGGDLGACSDVVTDGEKAHDGKFDRIEAVDT